MSSWNRCHWFYDTRTPLLPYSLNINIQIAAACDRLECTLSIVCFHFWGLSSRPPRSILSCAHRQDGDDVFVELDGFFYFQVLLGEGFWSILIKVPHQSRLKVWQLFHTLCLTHWQSMVCPDCIWAKVCTHRSTLSSNNMQWNVFI